MKRILPLLLALVMVLSLAAPALAAEDVFEASEAEEAAAPEAPMAPVEEAPEAEAPAVAPDLPQTAAAEPEDAASEDTQDQPQTGKLTVLGETDKLWFVTVMNDAGRTDYIADYEDITLHVGDEVYLIMDYRYTIQWDQDSQPKDRYGVLIDEMPDVGLHAGDVANIVFFIVTSLDDSNPDGPITIMENPDAPEAIPVTWEAPEGVTVEASDFVLLLPDFFGVFICDAGYVPLFTGVRSLSSHELEDGRFETYFGPKSDAESIHVDVKKATGELHVTGLTDKMVQAFASDPDSQAIALVREGLVGGMTLAVAVEAGCSVKADIEPSYEHYVGDAGVNLHIYSFEVPETGDFNIEVVKTPLPVDVPASGTGWACDGATGDYYYFVNGEQKFDYWVSSQRGLWYYVGQDGKLATGFQYVHNSNGTGWYMFQTDNKDGCIGRMLTGWQWTYTGAGMGWFNTGHGGVNGQCTWTEKWGAYSAATGLWADGQYHHSTL